MLLLLLSAQRHMLLPIGAGATHLHMDAIEGRGSILTSTALFTPDPVSLLDAVPQLLACRLNCRVSEQGGSVRL